MGYDSTNNYRIWNPKLNKIISTRDVIFDENTVFSRDIQQLKDDLLNIKLKELSTLLNRINKSKLKILNILFDFVVENIFL